MPAIGKHFPGHGAVRADSHVTLPIDPRSFEDIAAEDLLPFERMVRFGLAGVMPAHVVYPQIDVHPAGFSRFWIQEVLRGRLGFQGVVFSDDLHMAAAGVAGGYLDRAHAALLAGCDMVLVCNSEAGAVEVITGLQGFSDPAGQMRLARMHGRHGTTRAHLQQDPHWRRAAQVVQDLGDSPWMELDV